MFSEMSSDPPNPIDERRQSLEPYLEQLRPPVPEDPEEIVEGDDDESQAAPEITEADIPEALSIDDVTLELDSWERQVLLLVRRSNNGGAPRWCKLVVEGLAYRAKCLALARELAQHGEDEIEALDDALTLDTAIGIALMAELQANIDHLIRAGKVADMRKLTDFRNSVADGLGRIRSAITDSERLVAKAKSLELIRDEFIKEEPEETRRKAPEQYKKDAPRVREISRTTIRKRSFVIPLLFVLLASAVAWGVLHVSRTEYVPPPELTMSDLAHIGTVRAVRASPPSLYVDLDLVSWQSMSTIERQSVIEQIGIVANQAGYLGVQAWTTDNVPVGQWLEKSGTRLITPSVAESSVP
jgi:hypothetical protein